MTDDMLLADDSPVILFTSVRFYHLFTKTLHLTIQMIGSFLKYKIYMVPLTGNKEAMTIMFFIFSNF